LHCRAPRSGARTPSRARHSDRRNGRHGDRHPGRYVGRPGVEQRLGPRRIGERHLQQEHAADAQQHRQAAEYRFQAQRCAGHPEKAALINGVSELLLDVLNEPLESSFVIIEEVDTDNRGPNLTATAGSAL
jgi:phenylpyruvate tautomerase PptA (4-oxalocrotonate tautomerase family)